MSHVTVDPNATVWNCHGCAREQPESDDITQFCPTCGGVWVRPVIPRSRRQRLMWGRFAWFRRRRLQRYGSWDELRDDIIGDNT